MRVKIFLVILYIYQGKMKVKEKGELDQYKAYGKNK